MRREQRRTSWPRSPTRHLRRNPEMRRLFALIGVDFDQWRALIQAYTLIDYAALRGVYGHEASMQAARHLIVIALCWTIFGGGAFAAVVQFHDAWLAATIAVATTMMLVAFIVVAQADLLLGAQDWDVIGFRPVSSRTYFAVRLTATLMQALEMAIFTSYLPAIGFLLRGDGTLREAGAMVLAAIAASVFMGTTLALLYAALAARVGTVRLSRWMPAAAGLLMLALFAMDGALVVKTIDFSDARLSVHDVLSLSRSWSVLWFPAVWFAAAVQLAAHGSGALVNAAVTCGLLAVGLLPIALRSSITTQFASTLAAAGSTTSRRTTRAGDWSRLKSDTRAIVLLALAQVRSDSSFQMQAVITIAMPIVMFALFRSIAADMFSPRGGTDSTYLYAAIFTPTTLFQAFIGSAAYHASWIFFTTPADRVRLVLATRNVAALVLLAPLSIVVLVALWIVEARFALPIGQTAFVMAFAFIQLQLGVALQPALP